MRGRRDAWVWKGFGLAWLLHGLYDTLVVAGGAWVLLLLPLIGTLVVVGITSLRKGRKLSLARWTGAVPAASVERPMSAPAVSKVPMWMAVVAHLLLALGALFWLLPLLGLADSTDAADRMDTILGGILLSAIPLGLGVVLEVSYRRRRRRLRAAGEGAGPVLPAGPAGSQRSAGGGAGAGTG